MAKFRTHGRVLEGQLGVVRTTCQGTLQDAVQRKGLAILASHRFDELIHQLVSDTLSEIQR